MTGSLKIDWDGSLNTGNRAIDVQHKYLVGIINDLAGAIEEKKTASSIRKILHLLKYYTKWHFGREEQCMERHKCPVAAANKTAHTKFISTFEQFEVEFRETGGSEEFAMRMYKELTNWLVMHIQKVDKTIEHCAHEED